MNKEIDFNSYIFNGWGLSKKAMVRVCDLIRIKKLKRALEFGSGQSTKLLTELGIDFVSYDSDKKFAYNDDRVLIRDLKQLNETTFDDVINNKKEYMDIVSDLPSVIFCDTRTPNLFYDTRFDDFKGDFFDLVILDGPNGSGRSIAFNVIKHFIAPTAYIVIDDFNHYPFIENLLKTFPMARCIESINEDRGDNSGRNDSFEIYEIQKTCT